MKRIIKESVSFMFLALLIGSNTMMCLPVLAQNNLRIDKLEAWQPDYIRKNNGASVGQDGPSWQQWCEARVKKGDLGENTHTVWVAYSDRNNNNIYGQPSYDNKRDKKLDFGQRVYVGKIQNGFALVFTDKNKVEYSRGPGKNADFLGWVPIENLLLWEECPKSKSQIYEKALVVYDPASDMMHGEKPRKNPPYILDPTMENDTSKLFARDLDILFVMKKTVLRGETYYLLSNQVNFGNDVRSSLLGWLPEVHITPWDQRLVLEPTIDKAAIRDYEKRGIKPAAFIEFKDAGEYYKGSDPNIMNKAIYQYDAFGTKDRMEPLIMRHPIISKTSNDHIFKVAIMTGKGEDVGNGYASEKARYQREIEELTKKQQKY